jgi:hypothetical protein
MQDRYGRTSRPGQRRLLIAAGGLLLAVALAFITWITVLDRAPLNWDDIGFKVISDAQIEVTFDVNFSTGSATDRPSAVCTVHALNDLRTEVGLQDVTVTAGPEGRVRATMTLQTSERATTGLVKDCVPAER